ncbi:YpmS family protein [Periweissella beninensis]|uniref:YpmS family protein n=1 Tax=Periweissella beninensis TaxID=504936 RepID=A0ABT0VFZ8_9LACO|nr:YpmS family protein [Periweissella beninensis]MBM7543850.1 uncharacterized protein YpmS [Periweissella beninensis]MCM2436769.1 YpmS family protein [Periweissella beninensis]MCT4395523.1 DUF2140 family protein [Periweissella beninensis]
MQRERKQKAPTRLWFWLFWALATLIIISGITATTLVFVPNNYQETQQVNTKTSDFEISLQKNQINRLAKHFLSQYQNKQTKLQFVITDEALLTGTVKILGQNINAGITFKPTVTKAGNINLKASSMAVGSLNLPVSLVLAVLKQTYSLPNWVHVNAKSESILFDLNALKLSNGLTIHAKTIDIDNDKFVFEGGIK